MNMQSETKWRVTSSSERGARENLKEKLMQKENYFQNENILKTGAKLIKLMLGFWASSQAVGKYLPGNMGDDCDSDSANITYKVVQRKKETKTKSHMQSEKERKKEMRVQQGG